MIIFLNFSKPTTGIFSFSCDVGKDAILYSYKLGPVKIKANYKRSVFYHVSTPTEGAELN
jgi:hypothetical protein